MIIGSCCNAFDEGIKPFPIQSEFMDLESDTLYFDVYGKNPYLAIDSFIWVKYKDTTYYTDGNRRRMIYKIHYSNGTEEIRSFDIEPTKLSSTSISNNYSLPIYKSYLLNVGKQNFYFERDPSGTITRFFSSKLVPVNLNYFKGNCVWSYLEMYNNLNDSMRQKIIIDEYFGYKSGPVKFHKQFSVYFNGSLYKDSFVDVYRKK